MKYVKLLRMKVICLNVQSPAKNLLTVLLVHRCGGIPETSISICWLTGGSVDGFCACHAMAL